MLMTMSRSRWATIIRGTLQKTGVKSKNKGS
jgi:hypothetical protein